MKLVHWPWVGSYIWYSEKGTGWGRSQPRTLLTVPNVTTHPSTVRVPITVLLYNGPLLCGFNVPVKGSTFLSIWSVLFGQCRLRTTCRKSKGPFIATQLNSTELNSTSSCRNVHSANNCHLSMNVVTQLTQFVGRDVINKNITDLGP